MKKRKKKRTQAVRVLDQRLYRKQLQRRWLKIGVISLFPLLFFFLWLKLHDPALFPIQVITIEGDYSHIEKHALDQAIQPFTHSNFFTINMMGLRERLLQFHWLQSVFISKEWPNHLHIQLKEHHPVAIWNNDALLNNEGTLFTASKERLPPLPFLEGPSGDQNKVWQTFVDLNAVLTALHLKITKLSLSDQQSWSLELSNGLHLALGQQNLKTRVLRFAKAYPLLSQNNTPIDYIDLRYAHGMAVKYKNMTEGWEIHGKEKIE